MIKKFKNLLLPIIMVFAFTSRQITQAMDTAEEEKAIVLSPISKLTLDLEGYILQIAVIDSCCELSFAGNIGSVCKTWNNFFNKENYTSPLYKDLKVNLQTKYFHDLFYNGELIYRPNPDSDEGMIRLKISDLENPLEGKFDLLSTCGAGVDAVLSLYTGYRKVDRLEKENKVQIWFVLMSEIINELKKKNSSADRFKRIMKNWPVNCPIAILWTWGNNDDLNLHDYLTNKKITEINSNNLYKNWCGVGLWRLARDPQMRESQKFHVNFK